MMSIEDEPRMKMARVGAQGCHEGIMRKAVEFVAENFVSTQVSVGVAMQPHQDQ